MLPSACCARWSSRARSAGARARPRARPPAWRCPPSSAPGRRAASTPSTPASPCCTLLYLKSEQFRARKLLSRALRMWYHCVRDLAADVTTSKETSTRLLSPGSPTTTAIEDVPSGDTAVGARPALVHPVHGWSASRLRRARHGADLAPYLV